MLRVEYEDERKDQMCKDENIIRQTTADYQKREKIKKVNVLQRQTRTYFSGMYFHIPLFSVEVN